MIYGGGEADDRQRQPTWVPCRATWRDLWNGGTGRKLIPVDLTAGSTGLSWSLTRSSRYGEIMPFSAPPLARPRLDLVRHRPRPACAGLSLALVVIATAAALPMGLHAVQDTGANRAGSSAQETSTGIPLALEHYAGLKRLTSPRISPDGAWATYTFSPNDGADTLFVRELDGDRLLTLPRGGQAVFSSDSRWAAYRIAPAGGGGSNAGGATTHLLELGSERTLSFSGVQSFRLSDDARWFLIRKAPASRDAEHSGTDLIVKDLGSGETRNIGNVSDFAFSPDEEWLAYTVDAAGRAGNGAYALEMATGRLLALSTGNAHFSSLRWNEAGDAVGVLRGATPEGMEQRENVLLLFGNLAGERPRETTWDPRRDSAFPRDHVLSHFAGIRWNDHGDRIFLGIREQREEGPVEQVNGGANVDVWHWADEQVQSVQARRASQARQATSTIVYQVPTGHVVRLEDESLASVTTHATGRWAIGRDPTPYVYTPQWGGQIADYYRVDLDTGERTLIVEALVRQMGTSPDGRWFLYFKDGILNAHDLEAGTTVDLSARAPVSFANETHSHPNEVSAYGMAGWTEDVRSVIVNHRYDIWRIPVAEEGEAENLTRGVGSERRIVFRIVDAGSSIDLSESLTLSAYGDRTKHTGYWRLDPGAEPEVILYEDLRIGSPIRADSTDRVLYTRESFTQFPDLWLSDGTLRNPRRITDTNPHLADFAWSPGRVLIDYMDRRGNELQATLALPAGYEPGKRYPMLVYFYETMSQQHHAFQLPRFDDRPHMATYASNGYLVLQPDIVYTMGEPGSSALDALTSAVQAVIDAGYADPERIGLQGHSWGGYQSSFVVTQTDMFAAVVTGAPVTNLVSFYNELYASSGNVQQGITESGQVRMGMGVTPWNAGELYRSQSPVHNVEGITTPLLILHGTEDGAVDWRQGLEFFNSARRNGKEVIFLSYPGEAHHLGRRANQEDFQVRMKQFFDHYLMGIPAPSWMERGVPYVDKYRIGPEDGPVSSAVTNTTGGEGGLVPDPRHR